MKDASMTMTIRINESLKKKYDDLAAEIGITRNKLIVIAMQYALENLHEVKEESAYELYSRAMARKEI